MVGCGCIEIYGEIITEIDPTCNEANGWNNPHTFKVANRFKKVGEGKVLSVSITGKDYLSSPTGSTEDKIVVMMSAASWEKGGGGYANNRSQLELFADIGQTLYMERVSGKVEGFRNYLNLTRLMINPAVKLPTIK